MATTRTTNLEAYDAELGIRLYCPTKANPKYRLDYTDPFTGTRTQRSRKDPTEARALWEQAVEYLSGAPHATTVISVKPSGRSGSTVDDVFAQLCRHWQRKQCAHRYVQTRTNLYRHRIQPVIGQVAVLDWGSNPEHTETVMGNAHADGLAPASIQNLGTLLRSLVSQAWRDRWLPRGDNPMDHVRYVAGSTQQGEHRNFVAERGRASTTAVEELITAYEVIGDRDGIPWLADRARVAAYGGLRPGEQDCLRINDLCPEDAGVLVDEAFTQPRGSGPVIKRPKNGKIRLVRLPGSVYRRLEARAELLRSSGLADDALLFADPADPYTPLSESRSRTRFIKAALQAGWETVAVERKSDAKRHLGPDRRPRHTYYTLRHHAATWMHEVAEMAWRDVSRSLGHHSVAFTLGTYERSDADSRDQIRRNLAKL